jgi:hypothetical protein
MKGVETNEHIIREAVERGEIVLEHAKSHDNDADMLTKPLSQALHTKHSYQVERSPTTSNDHGPTHSKPYKPEPTCQHSFYLPTITPTKIITPIYSTTYQSGLRTL